MLIIVYFQIGVATFSTYIFMSENHRLDAQTAFVALSLFDVLRGNLNYLPWLITDFIKVNTTVITKTFDLLICIFQTKT